MMKQYPQARKFISEIIEKGIKDHPELGIGTNSEGVEVRSVGNTLTLKETALVEAFNMKAAIEYESKNCTLELWRLNLNIVLVEAAKDSMADMPPRSEGELDAVTLHNMALIHMDDNPNEHLPKLNFLLTSPACPPPTFSNLLLLYCKYGYYHVAADVLAENAHLTYTHLDPVIPCIC
jgi:tetratricopeptide repeat protein 30